MANNNELKNVATPGHLDAVKLRAQHIRTLEYLHSMLAQQIEREEHFQDVERRNAGGNDMDEAADARKKAEATIARLEKEAQLRNDTVVDLERQLALAWKQVAASKKQSSAVNGFRDELNAMKKSSSLLQQQLTDITQERDERGVKIAKLKTELGNLRKAQKASSNSQSFHEAEKHSLKQELEMLRTSAKEYKTRMEAAESELNGERASLRERQAEWRKLLEDTQRRLERNVQKWKAEAVRESKRAQSAETSAAAATARMNSLGQLVEDVQQKLVGCTQERDAVAAARQALALEVARLQAEIEELRPKVSGNKSRFGEFVGLKQENHALQKQVKRMKKRESRVSKSTFPSVQKDDGSRSRNRRMSNGRQRQSQQHQQQQQPQHQHQQQNEYNGLSYAHPNRQIHHQQQNSGVTERRGPQTISVGPQSTAAGAVPSSSSSSSAAGAGVEQQQQHTPWPPAPPNNGLTSN